MAHATYLVNGRQVTPAERTAGGGPCSRLGDPTGELA